MENAWISSSGPVILVHSYLLLQSSIIKEDLLCLLEHSDLIRTSSIILRLTDDLGSSEGQSSLQELVTEKLDHIRETRLRIPVYAKRVDGEFVVKKVAVRDQVCNIIRGIQSVSGFISATLSPMPPAALAWAGVLVILPVSTLPVLTVLSPQSDMETQGCSEYNDQRPRCYGWSRVYLVGRQVSTPLAHLCRANAS